MDNFKKPNSDEQTLIQFSDSGSDEEMQKSEDSDEEEENNEDGEDKDDGTVASDDDREGNGEKTSVQLQGIHSGMLQSTLKTYIKENTTGLKEMEELFAESDILPPTQMTTLHFESEEAAQSAVAFLSACHLGPGCSKIKVKLVETQHPSSVVGKLPPVKESIDKKSKRHRKRPQRNRDKTKEKTPITGGGLETQSSSVTLEVKFVSMTKEEFKVLLNELKIPSFRRLVWKPPPQKSRVFLLFKKQEDAATAQKILNSYTVKPANKNLVAVLRVKPKQDESSKDSKINQVGAASGLASCEAGLATGLQDASEKQDKGGSRKFTRRGQTRASGQQPDHYKHSGGACYISPHDYRPEKSPGYPHPRHGQQECKEIPSLLELPLQRPMNRGREADGCDRNVVPGASNISVSPKATAIHVTNIDTRVQPEGFRVFLLERGIPFTNLNYDTSRRHALIHFATTSETTKSRAILNNQWIIPRGPLMHANFSTASNLNSQSRKDDIKNNQGFPSSRGAPSSRPPQRPHQGGNRGRGREGRQRNNDESDKFSESSEVTSITSRKSFVSSTHGGRLRSKTSSLRVTNIGKGCDKEEFCGFLEALDLKCKCLEFRYAQRTKFQFAVIQFPDSKKATDARKMLNSGEWTLGSETAIKATFFFSKQATGGGSSLKGDLDQLEGDDCSYSSVQNWLEGNEASKENDQIDLGDQIDRTYPGRHHFHGRGSSTQGRGAHGNYRGSNSWGHNHSGHRPNGQGYSTPEGSIPQPIKSNQMVTDSQTDCDRSGRDGFHGRGRQSRGCGVRGKYEGPGHRGHHGKKVQSCEDRAQGMSSYQGHDKNTRMGMADEDPEKHRKSEEGPEDSNADGTDDASRPSCTGENYQPRGRKQHYAADPEDLDELLLSKKMGSGNSDPPKEQEKELNPKEIVIFDLPKDITERDIVDILKKENCQGFINVRLVKEKNSRACSSKCFVNFRERKHGMDAVLNLYGSPIRGHRTQVRLSMNHEQVEPAIARKTLDLFKEKEMPEKVESIKSSIEGKIEKIESFVTKLTDALQECKDFAGLERCENSVAALQHQLDEQLRYLKEFNVACGSVELAIGRLKVKGVSALSEVQKIRHHFERECRRTESPLPVYGYRSDIQKNIRGNKAVVLQGETGSGKSTQIPQYVVDMELQGWNDNGRGGQRWRVVCTQPRRVAALTLAKRVAEEYGCRVGEEVGYFVGKKKSVSDRTVVTFMTDRKLLNMCIADPDLSEYTCIIVDEAHERSVDTDILLATLKKLLKKRQDLHLIIMSATINIKLFTDYLGGCAELSVPGRTFPVDKHWCGDDAGIGEGDYLKKAVQYAAKVHTDEGPGDILVFLTSANEIETACRDLAAMLGQKLSGQDDTFLILPLHGRLQPEDQMKVFAETRQGQRKIVFATNVAETSVTIKGIKYVIDTGVVKECQYDPKRSMSLLKVTTITRASAQQRAGRAGRTSPGVCYRLYTKEEYSDMEESMKPEILRVHLGMAALQLLELGVEDVENFDFIQAPDREASRQAMTTLRLLGAVDADEKLTPLGRKMGTLPLEPRLSKLVLEGSERGLAKEAVVLAALISAPGSIFYRGGSDKDKEKADQLKLQFCHESGDIITMLNGYCHWNKQPEKKQKGWCMENSMNSKTLRASKEMVKEISQVLKHEHSIDCNYDNMEVPDKAKSEILQKVIMSGYFQTLSLYNGHHRAGYTVLPQQKSAYVHPSSALRAIGSNPKWVVYEEFKRTSRDFLFNVTQVDITWLEEVAPVFHREIDVEALQEMAMEELPSIPLGTAVLRQLTLRRNEKLRTLEEKITAKQDSPCIIEVNRSTKELQMFVSKQCSSLATSYVKNFLAEECKMIERQQIEVPVGESGVVRQVVVAGAETRFILMAKDYRALEISNMPTDATEDDVERIVRFAGCSKEEILDVYRFPKQTTVARSSKWGRVTFISPEAAQDAKEWLDVAAAAEKTSPTVRAIQGQGFEKPDIRRVNSRVVITWFTWPSKGYAFINCRTTEEAKELEDSMKLQCVQVRGSVLDIGMKRNDTRGLFIKNVNKNTTQEELEGAIKKASDISFDRCSIAREPPSGPVPTPDEVTRDIYDMFEGVVDKREMNVEVCPVRSEKTQMHKAIVTFLGNNEGQVDACVADIQKNPRYNSAGQIYHVKTVASCIVFCRPEVFNCLEEEIKRLVATAKAEFDDLNVRVNKSKKTSDWMISVSGGKIQDVHTVRQALLAYIQGDTVPLHDLCGVEMSNQKSSRMLDILRSAVRILIQDLDAYATVDARRQVVVFFGQDRIRERLKKRVRDYIEIICNQMLREIPLTGGLSRDNTKGRAIRTLVKSYGPWLKNLQEQTGAEQIMLNTRQGVLLIQGNQKVFDKVHGMVYSCLQEAGLEHAISDEAQVTTEDVECGICYTPVEGNGEVYRLSACSHGFCRSCLQELFEVRLKNASKDYPIECPYDGCGSPMLLCDIRILCPKEDQRLLLYQWALEAHVTQKSNGRLKFCPTPDCHMIYEHTDAARTFVCPECRGRLCTSCGAEPHTGQTCAEFEISRKTFYDIERWMKASGSDAKKCPVPHCGITLEKTEGCNRVACLVCKNHICWKCLDYFDTEDNCYRHLMKKHGGFFD